ncbi:MAG: class I SAM-dependent RNA methyltransferase [Clostridium sp.]
MSNLTLIATSAFGIESIVAKEIKNLGYTDVTVENGKITYIADERGVVKSNLWLRCSDRVYIKIGEFKATSFEELFENTKALPWEDFLPIDAEFPVADAKSVKSGLFSLSDIQSIVKKAVVEKLKSTYSIDWFKEDGAKYPIHVSILKDIVTITINTSGDALHKRGYRERASEAPLKETLAAALIKVSGWTPDKALIDPFCGSGTIPIEAALIGRNIAPGLNRKFISENWAIIPKEIWKEERKKAYTAIDYNCELDISGVDIDKSSIAISRENSIEAGVDDCIHFQQNDMNTISSKRKDGYIICNPPYGERLNELAEIQSLYTAMGTVFSKFITWNQYIITSYEYFEKYFGKTSDKNRKLYNGRIKCYYYQYLNHK